MDNLTYSLTDISTIHENTKGKLKCRLRELKYGNIGKGKHKARDLTELITGRLPLD